MKLDYTGGNIEVIGNVTSNTMSIKHSNKLFSMMVDGLYKDKHGSIIRELSANALDVHNSCGLSDVPFSITLPTDFSNKLIIQDFGNGLSEENIIKYFGTLLETSKDQDNTAVGAYGIGCKSPFSIVDEFVVVSINNGIKTTVAFMRENKGIPQFFVTNSTKTKDASGTTIIIEDKGQYKYWERAVAKQLAALKVKPICNIEINYPELKYIGEFAYCSSNLFSSNVMIDMGQILYPIDMRDFPDINFLNTNKTIIYKCEIDDINVPPDRERIELTHKTKDAIPRIIDTQNKEIINTICSEFESTFKFDYNWYMSFIRTNSDVIHNIDVYLNKLTIEFASKFKDTIMQYGVNNKLDNNLLNYLTKSTVYNRTIFKKPPSNYNDEDGILVKSTIGGLYTLASILANNIPIIIAPNAPLYSIQPTLTNNNVVIIRTMNKSAQQVYDMLMEASPFFKHTAGITLFNNSGKTARAPAIKNVINLRKYAGIYKLNENGYRTAINESDITHFESNKFICYSERQYGYTNRATIAALQKVVKMKSYIMSDSKYNTNKAFAMRPFEVCNEYLMSDIMSLFDAHASGNELDTILSEFLSNKYHVILHDKANRKKYIDSKYTLDSLNNIQLTQLMKLSGYSVSDKKRPLFDSIIIDAISAKEFLNANY